MVACPPTLTQSVDVTGINSISHIAITNSYSTSVTRKTPHLNRFLDYGAILTTNFIILYLKIVFSRLKIIKKRFNAYFFTIKLIYFILFRACINSCVKLSFIILLLNNYLVTHNV